MPISTNNTNEELIVNHVEHGRENIDEFIRIMVRVMDTLLYTSVNTIQNAMRTNPETKIFTLDLTLHQIRLNILIDLDKKMY